MKYKKIIYVLLAAMLLMVGCGGEKPDTASGASKKEGGKGGHPGSEMAAPPAERTALAFESIPEKVVVGTVGLTEIFDALEIDLVGVPSSKSYSIPERYKEAQEIGMSMKPDLEIIKSLEPDQFITDALFESSLGKSLKEKGIPTSFVATSGYDDIVYSIENIGHAFGKDEKAKALTDKMKAIEKEVADRVKNEEKKKVMVIFGTPESFMLATKQSYIGDLVNRLGLENVADAAEGKGPYIPFSIEAAVNMNPDVILRFTHTDPETSKKMFDKEFAENPVWNALEAVKNKTVYDLDPHYFGVTANIRGAEALQILADMIYGK